MNDDVSRRAIVGGGAALAATAMSGCNKAAATAPTSDALGDLDATGVAARIRSKEITASEALEAAIARVEKVNPQLNFMASKQYEYGRDRAKTALTGPFAGVPTLIKDLQDVKGLPTGYGSRAFAQNVATAQAPYMDAVLATGIVPFGKSTTPEFGLTATTESLATGATHNPWDVTRSSGGSSGGSAAAVAARAAPIASASDGGGSVRIPASCCGLFGLKVSRDRHLPIDVDRGFQISVPGCESLSVRDTAAWLAATERQGPTAAFPPVGVVTGPNRQRLKIALAIKDTRGHDPDPEVAAAIQDVAKLCTSLGHEVTEATVQINGEQFLQDFILLWAAGAADVVQLVKSHAGTTPLDQLLEPLTLDLAQHYAQQGQAKLVEAIGRLHGVEAAYAQFFTGHDVMLTPVLAAPPIALGQIAPSLGMQVGFARVLEYVTYTPLQNVAGGPAMSVPLSWSRAGLPIGSHFSAAKGQERKLLELAYELEQARPWAQRKPVVNAS
ncbi:MAG: amidase [Terricaulis sp.]